CWVRWQSHTQGERKHMTKGIAVGCMAVFAGVLLATMTSVYADHAATGKGTYAVAPQVSETRLRPVAEFHFVVARQRLNPDLNLIVEPGLNFVQSTIAGRDHRRLFQTFMISTALAPFDITTEPAGRTVTIKGELVSTTFLEAGSER